MSILQLFTIMQPQYSVTLSDCKIRIITYFGNALWKSQLVCEISQCIMRYHSALWKFSDTLRIYPQRVAAIHYGPHDLFLVDFTTRCGYFATRCEMPTINVLSKKLQRIVCFECLIQPVVTDTTRCDFFTIRCHSTVWPLWLTMWLSPCELLQDYLGLGTCPAYWTFCYSLL